MSKIAAELVKQLRDRTGVSMSKCKEALESANSDMDKAIEFLRKAGIASAVKKEGRDANEGLIEVDEEENALVLVEVNAETDFVAQNAKFKQFVQELIHQAILTKPVSVAELMQLSYVKDPSLTLDQYRSLIVQSLGENIQVRRLLIIPKSSDVSVGFYSHMRGKIVSVVVLTGGKGHEILARDIAMHVAAEAPEYLSPEEVPDKVKAKEKEIARSQVQNKPPHIIDKIVEGKLEAYYMEMCLTRQKYVKDSSMTIAMLLDKESKELKHPIGVQSFYRWKVGN
ncbi:Elongation factor Ts [Candidatus Rhabdochlamydia oedothoracis]|uniref:Elongation factor Ts n=1 Tax=Candidatus Rhabdochlamydia oedothoracis TaxID=2720720 RepID=A0ABX8V557_9BACT|nr:MULTISPECIES: translation elongation factor Ts [Rhabdochlamydia]KAG6559638.1 Elongation factor Ts [Candidatus Rhabdochlamydia sp. W815]MCL6755947.1 translation elongation factor Ts [Candidatus Rhabdochlamydia oedothoracis]QYF48173.1 Elongation factor Ts [Candidatus Rhabdochlamydia oedothoracis]